MANAWTDVTSYSRSEPADERVPRTWEQEIGRLRVCVTRKHRLPGSWFIICHELHIDMDAETDDLAKAKALAVATVQARAAKLLKWAMELKA